MMVFLYAIFFVLIGNSGCSDSPTGEEIIVPENLIVTVTPVGMDANNPNGDGSGAVVITMSAQNATSYKVNFGDNEKRRLNHTMTLRPQAPNDGSKKNLVMPGLTRHPFIEPP